LIAQVLPFATLLQGLEVFHASAIVHDGDAVAFLGRSRTGKTSLALELCGRGSSFLADDVLALESRQGSLLAHPGTPIAGVDRTAADHAHGAHTIRAKDVLAVNARERLVAMSAVGEAKPLAQLFFLERQADGPKQPRFEATEDVQLLLGATFNFVLVTPERLRGLLEACALAARLRVERVVFGSATDVSELAGAVERRLSRQA
jgi:serine kinase of HPr protein (carbohydrate metabolism regulator)